MISAISEPSIGKCVLLTRPMSASTAMWQDALEAAGLTVMCYPCLSFEPSHSDSQYDPLAHTCVFSSVPAVEGFFKKRSLTDLAHKTIYAVGPATAQALQAHGVTVQPLMKPWGIQGILKGWESMSVQPSISLICGESPCAQTLQALDRQGVPWKMMTYYRRVPSQPEIALHALWQEKPWDYVLLTSVQIAEIFLERVQELSREKVRWTWVVNSQRLLLALQEKGVLGDKICVESSSAEEIAAHIQDRVQKGRDTHGT